MRSVMFRIFGAALVAAVALSPAASRGPRRNR